tara:strand:- start:40 stop:2019 length:1980 start_codon:yes stop_codon:yes gene_type:complete
MATKTLLQLLLEAGIKLDDAKDLIKRSGVEGEGILATNVGNLIFKAQQGDLILFNSRLQNPTKHAPYNAYAIGSDKRFVRLTSEYNMMDKAIRQHLKVLNDDKKLLSPEQMKTLKYNIVVRNQTKNEIDRLNKVLTDEGTNTVDLLKNAGVTTSGRITGAGDPSVTEYIKQLNKGRETGVLPPESSVTLGKQTAKRQIAESEQELKTQLDQAKQKLEDDVRTGIAKLGEADQLRKAQNEKYGINFKHQGAGKGFDREGDFNAVTREVLPLLHDRGIIKLDDEIYKSLKDAEWVRGMKGQEFDPKRIFRYHFGDKGFGVLNEALDKTPNMQSAGDVVNYITDNNLIGQLNVKKVNSPKDRFDHMTLTELQGIADEKRGIALLIKDGESPFYETADQIKKGSDNQFRIMDQYLTKIRERVTRPRRDQLAKIKKFPALDPNDPNFIISNLNDEGLVTAKSNRFQYSVEADPSGTTQFRTKYDTWDDATGTMREKPKLVEKENMATGEIVLKDIDYNIPPTKEARMSLDIAIQMGDDVFDFSTEALGKKGYNLDEIDTIQKGKKVYDLLEQKKKIKTDPEQSVPAYDINTGEVTMTPGSPEGVDLYYTGRNIIEKLKELKDLGVDDIDRISLDEFDPTRYGFSKGGIANKDMVRFLFDDNVRN